MAEPDLATLVAQSQRMAQQASGPVLQRNFELINEEARKVSARPSAGRGAGREAGREAGMEAAH